MTTNFQMDLNLSGLIFMIIMVISSITLVWSQEITDEYCEGHHFTAKCGPNHVIIMTSARYGRMRSGRCIRSVRQGCQNDVLPYMDTVCSGRHKCSVEVTDLLGVTFNTQCNSDMRNYLEASYKCVPVIRPNKDNCGRESNIETSQPEGFIASVVTAKTGCGGIDTPWLITVPKGQKINFTLWDFNMTSASENNKCHVYAIIKDLYTMQRSTLCSTTGLRTSQVYVSEGNQAEVRLFSKNQDHQIDFLIYYEAYGCKDIPMNPGGSFQRAGNSAIISCTGSSTKWRLKCVANQWQGKYENCTNGLMSQASSGAAWDVMGDAQGLSVVIIVGVAVLVGLIILIIGLICLRSMRRQHAMLKRTPEHYTQSNGTTSGYLGVGPGSGLYGGALIPYVPGDKACEPLDPTIPSDIPQNMDAGHLENKYYRTWQLQNHHNQKQFPTHITSRPNIVPGQRAMSPSYSTGGRNTYPYVEHIYESPKFDRKEYSCDETMNYLEEEQRDGAQYYELDLTVSDGENSNGHKQHTSRSSGSQLNSENNGHGSSASRKVHISR